MRKFLDNLNESAKEVFRRYYFQDYYYPVAIGDLKESDLTYKFGGFWEDLSKLLKSQGLLEAIVALALNKGSVFYLITSVDEEVYLIIPNLFESLKQASKYATRINELLKGAGISHVKVETREVPYNRDWEFRGRYELAMHYPQFKYYFEFIEN